MEYDLSQPGETNAAVNQSELSQEFIPSFGVTEIPDFDTFSKDPDKYISQVVDPNQKPIDDTSMQTQEVDPAQPVQDDTLPPVDDTSTQEVQSTEEVQDNEEVQSTQEVQDTEETGSSDMPGADDAEEGSEESTERETLQ